MLKDKYVYVCKYCGKIKKVQINEYFDGLCDKCKEKMTIFGKEYITKESN